MVDWSDYCSGHDPIAIIFVFSMLIFILLISHHLSTGVVFIFNMEEVFWIFFTCIWWFVASWENSDMFSKAGFKIMSLINKI